MSAKSLEKELAALAAIRSDPTAAGSVALLRVALANKVNLVVAKAAAIVQASEQSAFCPAMADALRRFFAPGTDKGCPAKTALAELLADTLGYADAEAFLPGVRHIQTEPSYGGSVDVAVDLRGWSALGLARAGYRDVMTELADLMADAEPACRQMAARAMAYAGADAAVPLLRYKVLAGDRETGVTAECFAALMKLAPRKSLAFVGRYLGDVNPDVAGAAALSIGETRTGEAWAFLRDAWERAVDAASRDPLLPGIAMTRHPEAVAFLVERVAQDRPAPAAEAVAALAIYRHDPAVRELIARAAARNGDPAVVAAVEKAFG